MRRKAKEQRGFTLAACYVELPFYLAAGAQERCDRGVLVVWVFWYPIPSPSQDVHGRRIGFKSKFQQGRETISDFKIHSQQLKHTTMASRSRSPTPAGAANAPAPILRVMRLQKPDFHLPPNHLDSSNGSLLRNALCLPDSLAVYVGESFTAYVGVLNSSSTEPIRKLTVNAQLRTPSERYPLASRLDQSNLAGIDVGPDSGVDAIVSRNIEEAGEHILRVDVGYVTSDGGTKTFRKFYRFNVTSPLRITNNVLRVGDSKCFVSIFVEYTKHDKEKQDPLGISVEKFDATEGLTPKLVGSPFEKRTATSTTLSAVDLLDESGLLQAGGSVRFLFSIEATSKQALLRGIAGGDSIGRVFFKWSKAMGESGTLVSPTIQCPRADLALDQRMPFSVQKANCEGNSFVVHRSGLAVDVAVATTARTPLGDRIPVTVDPIDPPPRMRLNVPCEVQFLVVNHSNQPLSVQLQFSPADMAGIVVCGTCYKNVGELGRDGGSTVATIRFMPLAGGLFSVRGCAVKDMVTGREMVQPPLFTAFVDTAPGL